MKTFLLIFLVGFILACSFNISAYSQVGETNGLQNKPSEITIAGKTGGEITKDELLNSKGLETSIATHQVRGFSMTVLTKELNKKANDTALTIINYDSNNNELTTQMKEAIKQAPPGAAISFEGIHCYPEYKTWHYVLPLNFKLK